MSGRWNHHYFKIKTKQKAGQALLELAIFGAFLIMLLGILINYGLRYNFQQQVTQEAFRRAISSAADSTEPGKPSAVTQVVVRDKHIPDPSSPWAVGSVMPFSSSAAVTRNYRMQNVADTPEELPAIAMDVQEGKCLGSYLSDPGSSPPCYYLTAGFREESNVDEGSIDKYIEIYGNTLQGCAALLESGDCSPGGWENISDKKYKNHNVFDFSTPNYDYTLVVKAFGGGEIEIKKFEINEIRSFFSLFSLSEEERQQEFPWGIKQLILQNNKPDGGWTEDKLEKENSEELLTPEDINKFYLKHQSEIGTGILAAGGTVIDRIRFIDPNAGEIMSYDNAVRTCRQIVDDEVCKTECKKGRKLENEVECDTICSKDVKVPWYCEGYSEENTSTHKYKFPKLNDLFAVASGGKSMGLQSDYTKDTAMYNTLQKTESAGEISTQEGVNWQDNTTRWIVYIPYGSQGAQKQELRTRVGQDETKTLTTPWEK